MLYSTVSRKEKFSSSGDESHIGHADINRTASNALTISSLHAAVHASVNMTTGTQHSASVSANLQAANTKGRSRLLAAMAAVDADTREKKQMQHKRKRRQTGITHDKDQLLASAMDAFNKKGVASHAVSNAREMSCKLQLDYLIERTNSVDATEFLDRYFAAHKTKDSLRAMQNLADSKLSQLRTEHAELLGSLGKTRFQVEEDGADASKNDLFVAVGGHSSADRRRESTSTGGGTIGSCFCLPFDVDHLWYSHLGSGVSTKSPSKPGDEKDGTGSDTDVRDRNEHTIVVINAHSSF
jgi:hypothetical protein